MQKPQIIRHVPVLVAALLLGSTVGCSGMRLPWVMDEIKAGKIAGVPSSAVGTYIYPERADRRRYERVELLQNVALKTTDKDRQSFSFVLGRRTSDGEWEIISVGVLADDETWSEVPVIQNSGGERRNFRKNAPDP